MATLGERDLRVAHLEGLAERDGDEPLLDLVDRRPTRNTPAHRCVVVERADDELGGGWGAVDRNLRSVPNQQRQRAAVVQVRVRYHRRVEPVEPLEVRCYG